MKCKHEKVANHQCTGCGQPMMIKCSHPTGSDHAGFCKLSDCGEDIRFLTSNTLKKDIKYA